MRRAVVLWLGLALGAAPLAAQHHGGAHAYGRRSPSGSFRHRTHAPRPYSPSLSGSRYRAPSYRPAPPRRAPRARHEPVPGSRDRHRRLRRSAEARREFMRLTGHPHGWPGHVIDHRIPLACGGADAPSNMQWQNIAEAKAKDKVERRGCGTGRRR